MRIDLPQVNRMSSPSAKGQGQPAWVRANQTQEFWRRLFFSRVRVSGTQQQAMRALDKKGNILSRLLFFLIPLGLTYPVKWWKVVGQTQSDLLPLVQQSGA